MQSKFLLLALAAVAILVTPPALAYHQGQDCPWHPLPPPPEAPKPPSKDEKKPPKPLPPIGNSVPQTPGNGMNDTSEPPGVVVWLGSAADAQKSALVNNRTYALYFCDKETAKVCGDGPAVLEEYKKSHARNSPAPTIFDSAVVLTEFRLAGLQDFAKVPVIEDNAALCRKYNASVNTLVICAQDGAALFTLAGSACNQTNAVKFLQNGHQPAVAKWEQTQKDEQERLAKEQAVKEEREAKAAAVAARKAAAAAQVAKPTEFKLAINAEAAALDKLIKRLQASQQAGWKSADGNPRRDVAELLERVTNLSAVEGLAAQPASFLATIIDLEDTATALTVALRAYQKQPADPALLAELNQTTKRAQAATQKFVESARERR